MTSMKRLTAGAALAIGLLAQGGVQAQPSEFSYQFKGLNAYADFYMLEGCTNTSVYVSGSDDVVHYPGQPRSHTEAVYVSYWIYNGCTDQSSYGSGFTTDAVVSGNISSASVRAVVPVYEWSSGTTRTMTVDVTFDANRDTVSHGVSNYHYRTPAEHVHYRSVGRSVSADAVGTFTLDGTPLLTNASSSYASISLSNSGTVSVYRD